MANKEIREIIRDLKRKGWEVVQGRKHYKAKHRLGGIVSFSVTPSDRMAVKNILRDIEKLEKSHAELT